MKACGARRAAPDRPGKSRAAKLHAPTSGGEARLPHPSPLPEGEGAAWTSPLVVALTTAGGVLSSYGWKWALPQEVRNLDISIVSRCNIGRRAVLVSRDRRAEGQRDVSVPTSRGRARGHRAGARACPCQSQLTTYTLTASSGPRSAPSTCGSCTPPAWLAARRRCGEPDDHQL
jgi:hypothetical protein